ncbi:hypothetical protein B0H14DRAFT_2781594 [Mycena olivaceomarginata]|nr:hypothetical protein B0H14DRAFT_2781594 [Mycena olivaceomarginata]
MLSFKPLVRQLQGTPNESEREILAILTALQQNFQDCQGSLTVGRLRYHASPSISSLAKEIVKDWKVVVEEERARKRVARFRDRAPTPIVGTATSPQKQTSKQGGGKMRSSTVYSGLTGDKTRNSCIEMPAFELILLKATEIEAEVHKEYRGGSGLYLKATQTLFGYLQDKDNSVLREAVSSGDLPVERFLKMAGCRSLGHECAVES